MEIQTTGQFQAYVKDETYFKSNYYKATIPIKVGTLETSLVFKTNGSDEIIIEKPQDLKVAESAVGVFDYSDITSQYIKFRDDFTQVIEQRLKDQMAQKWQESYDFWKAQKIQDKVTLSIESKENFIRRASASYYTPTVNLLITGSNGKEYKIGVDYKNTASYNSRSFYGNQERMRFTTSNEFTDYRTRQYKNLNSMSQKMQKAVEEYIAKIQRQLENKEYEKKKYEWQKQVVEQFGVQTSYDYSQSSYRYKNWYLKTNGHSLPITIHSNHTEGVEFDDLVFSLGSIKRVKADIIKQILKILPQPISV